VTVVDKIIIDETRGNIRYKVGRRIQGASFTDYAVFRTTRKPDLTPFFSNLTDDSFDDIYELGKYYFLRSEKFYSGFAFLDSRKLSEFVVNDCFEGTGRYLDPKAALIDLLTRLSQEDKIRLNKDGFHCDPSESELESFLNEWLDKGYINADPRNNEKVIFKFIHPNLGNISLESHKNSMILNSNFFVLETMDMRSPYSMIGQPFGALIGKGEVMLPPLFKRDLLLRYKDGKTVVKSMDISDVKVLIGTEMYRDGENARFFRRPEFERTPVCRGMDLIIVNDEVMAYKNGGDSQVPDAGFVLQVSSDHFSGTRKVRYLLDEPVDFAVQVGPSLIRGGIPSERINGEFNSLITQNHTGISFPPNVFETQWDESKAARMAIGFAGEEMVLLWVAGCNAGEYIEGYDSLGFTFNEMTEVMLAEGVKDAVSLDGGGSSQLLNGKAKVLKLADRRGLRGHEFERPTPVGIKIKF
jgi:hypothetical protein